MNTFELLKTLKARVEIDSSFDNRSVIITDISGDTKHAKIMVVEEIEGRLRRLEVTVRRLADQDEDRMNEGNG